MTVQELASITVPDPQQLVIQPWDASVIKAIESAVRNSELQVNPTVDGTVIRIVLPPMTEEKRKELVKIVGQKAEDARVAVRRVREEELKVFKQQEKDGDISEDDYFREEKIIQAAIDDATKTINDIAAAKEDDLMTL